MYKTWSLIVISLVILVGCQTLNPPEKQGASALDDFIYALRWQQFDAAAGFMQPEFRKDFLATFKDNKDLTVVDVRLVEANVFDEGRHTETIIDMDYYLLPSLTVKTFRFEQTWVYQDQAASEEGYYQITTPFPPIP